VRPGAFAAGSDAAVAEFLLAGAADLEVLEMIILAAIRAGLDVGFVGIGEIVLGAVQRAVFFFIELKIGWMHGR